MATLAAGFHGLKASSHIDGVLGSGAQPSNAEEIAPGGAEPPQVRVFASSGEARIVTHGALGDTGALHFAEHGEESMETVPVLKVFDEGSAEGFQGASGIDDMVVEDEAAKCIGESGGEPFRERILPGSAIAAADIICGAVCIREQGRDNGEDIAGVVLSVGIEGDDDLTCCALKSQIHSGRLTAVDWISKQKDTWIDCRLFLHECRGSVRRSVV